MEGVSISDLPKHVISIVAARVKARSRVPDTAKPKLQIVASLPRRASAPLSVLPLSVDPLSVDPLSSASADPPPEVVRLATTYVEACDERKEQSRSLAPMRSDKKDLESGLKDQLAQPVVVQMSRGGRNVRLRISREEVPTKAKDVVGVRDFLRHVKEAVHTVAAEGPTVQDFQTAPECGADGAPVPPRRAEASHRGEEDLGTRLLPPLGRSVALARVLVRPRGKACDGHDGDERVPIQGEAAFALADGLLLSAKEGLKGSAGRHFQGAVSLRCVCL